MGLLSKFVGGAASEPLKVLGDVADNLFTSDDERLTHAEVMERIKNEPRLGQIVTNQLEAQHRTIFVAGWRPFIGWVCGLGLAYTFLIHPIIQWFTGLPGPALSTDIMLELVLGLLGLGTLRTVEKLGGVTK